MNIQREAVYGGERYYCADCGAIVEENFYPTTMVGYAARKLWEADKEEAEKQGIAFTFPDRCTCQER